MKTPLNYQVTESDCGTISFLNALSYVLNREEIPAQVAHMVMCSTLDKSDINGHENAGGTSVRALEFLQKWISRFAEFEDLPIKLKIYTNDDSDFNIHKSNKIFSENGCILACVWLMHDHHYVIITKISAKYAYIFDPYYVDSRYFQNNRNVKIIKNKPFSYNRKIALSKLLITDNSDYSLVKHDEYQVMMTVKRK
jgi:hypothetical protein